MKLAQALFILFCSSPIMAQDGLQMRWDVQVTDPEFELKNYKLEQKSFKPYLKKTSWRCQVGPEESDNGISKRDLFCDYSVEKAGTVKTTVSCSKQKPYSEGSFELFDERKNLTFQVMLKCSPSN